MSDSDDGALLAQLHCRLMSLNPAKVEIEDESHRHRGHAGARGGAKHLHVLIVSEAFGGLGRLARHRMVYDAAGRDLVGGKIHALRISALTPDEHTVQDS